MRSLLALTKKDLRGYFGQPTGYVLIVIFTALVSYWFFNAALSTMEASLAPLFTVELALDRPSLPWLLAIFAPACTMRLLAEEQRDGTLEILLTQPIRGWAVLAAKFLAGLAFVSVAILATVVIPIALRTAGNLDEGAIVAQYVGTIFLAAAFVSVGLFTSSATRNQIVAFVLALTVNMVLMLVGLDVVALALPLRAAVVLQDLSPVTHFTSIARGVLDLRDVLYFVALVATFLSATFLALRGKTLSHRSPHYLNLRVGVAGLVLTSLLVGWFGSAIGGRLDLTEDRLHTLSGGTRQILDGLDDLLTIKLFVSRELPPEDALVARDVNAFLDDLAARSGGEVQVVRRHPSNADGDADAIEAQLLGVPRVQVTLQGRGELQVKNFWLGLAMTYADRKEIIQYVDSMQGFEYEVASRVNRMAQTRKHTIGFLAGHGEASITADMQILASALDAQYDAVEVAAGDDGSLDLSGVDMVAIVGPTEEVPSAEREALAQYVDLGGKALLLIDPILVGFDRTAGGPRVAVSNENSFAEFAARYGVAVGGDLLFDMRSNVGVPLPYPYLMRTPVSEPTIGGNVETVVLAWAGSVGSSERQIPSLQIIPILETTPFGGRRSFAEEQTTFFDIRTETTPPYSAGELTQRVAAVAVTGPLPAGAADGDDAGLRLVVVGDADWLTDGVLSLLDQSQRQDNVLFALNLVDWLSQEEALARIRSKLVSSRQLLFSSKTQQKAVHYGSVGGMPALFIVLGAVQFARRRRDTQRVYRRAR